MDNAAATIDNETEMKRAYAAALLRHPQTIEGRFQAALAVSGDTGQALWMANKWTVDPEVSAFQDELIKASENGELDFIGTKSDFAREILERARASFDGDTAHKFYKLYAETRGFISKPENQLNVQVNNNRVMVVRDLGSDAEWEQKAAKQQRALIDVSASKH